MELVMSRAGAQGVLGKRGVRDARHDALLPRDFAEREFLRSQPNQLWVTDATKQRTTWTPAKEGKMYCAVVLDRFSRKVGWVIDSAPNAALVTNAEHMAIETRKPAPETVIH